MIDELYNWIVNKNRSRETVASQRRKKPAGEYGGAAMHRRKTEAQQSNRRQRMRFCLG